MTDKDSKILHYDNSTQLKIKKIVQKFIIGGAVGLQQMFSNRIHLKQ